MSNNTVVYNLSVNADQSQKTVGQLRKDYSSLNKELSNYQVGSQEYLDTIASMGDIKSTLKDIREEIDAIDPGAKVKAIAGVASQAVGAFSGLQGAIALVGGESEDLQKTLVKLNAAMALAQGVQSFVNFLDEADRIGKLLNNTLKSNTVITRAMGIANTVTAGTLKALGVAAETTSTSFKVLRGAIIATGIGALIVGIGLLIEKFQEWKSAADKAAEATKNANDEMLRMADAGLKAEQDYINRYEALAIARAKVAGKSEKEISGIQQQEQQTRINSLKRYLSELQQNEDLNAEKILEIKNQIANAENKLQVMQLEAEAKGNEEKRKLQKDAADKSKKANDAAIKASGDFIKKAEDQRKSAYRRERDDLREHYEQVIKLMKQAGLDITATQEAYLSQMSALNLKYNFQTVEQDKTAYSDRLGAVGEFAPKLLERNQTVVNTTVEQQQYARERLREIRHEQFVEEMSDLAIRADGVLTTTSSLFTAVEALQGEAGKRNKGLQIAMATVETLKGAVSGFMQGIATYPPPYGAIVGGAMAATALATGYAQIKKIKATDMSGKGSPAMPSYSPPQVPTQVRTTDLSSQSVEDLGSQVAQQTIIAKVSVTEVTEVQDRVNQYSEANGI